jgi:hypothetical protein
MTSEQRYYLFTYIKANKQNLGLTALEDSKQTQDIKGKLKFITPKLKVTIQTT